MRLKSLKLAGFKSFANPTTFTFHHGITAIVGPNGCGKSNVIDAIRWVLGESSAKQLRGGSMSDVIFAGTQDKGSKSLASVELVFEHTQDEHTGIRHELNLYHELAVRRQVNKDGKSDYFINGTRCRRRDVVDIFLGTGLGPRSYAVIQQGMIGRIVDSSPIQLSEFIEEAAGVSRYQARREETQKQLIKTHENLERLSDIKSEMLRQQTSLSKQAKNAQVYLQLQAKLNAAKQQLAVQQLYQAKEQEIIYKKNHDKYSKVVEENRSNCAKLKALLDELKDKMAQAQWLKDDAKDNLHEHDMARQQLAHKLANNESTITQLQTQLNANNKEQQQVRQEVDGLANSQIDTQRRLDVLLQQRDQLQHKQAQWQHKQQPLQAAWEKVTQRINEVQKAKRDLEQQQALQQQACEQLAFAQDKWAKNQQSWLAQVDEWDQWDESNPIYNESNNTTYDESDNIKLNLEQQLSTLAIEINSLTHQQGDIEERLADISPELLQLGRRLTNKRAALTSLQTRQATLMGEYNTLHRILQPPKPDKMTQSDHSSTRSEFVKPDFNKQKSSNIGANNSKHINLESSDPDIKLLNALTQLPRLLDSIQLTEAGKPYAKVLDHWLMLWLDSRILAQNQSHGLMQSLVNKLIYLDVNELADNGHTPSNSKQQLTKKQQLNKKQPQNESQYPHSILIEATHQSGKATPKPQQVPANFICLAQLIAAPNLALWQQCYLYIAPDIAPVKDNVADDNLHQPASLQALLSQLPSGSQLLTESGWWVNQTAIIHLTKLLGTTQTGYILSQRLAQQQRLQQLDGELDSIDATIEQHEGDIKKTSLQYDELNRVNQALNAQANQLLHRQHDLTQQRTKLISQQQQRQDRRQVLNERREQLDQERKEIEEQRQFLNHELVQVEQGLTKLHPVFMALVLEKQQLTLQRQQLDNKHKDDTAIWQTLQIDINKAKMLLDHCIEQTSKLNNHLLRLQTKELTLKKQLEKHTHTLPDLKAQLQITSAHCHDQRVALNGHHDFLQTLTGQLNKYQLKLNALEQALLLDQQKLTESTTKLAIAQERIIDASNQVERLNQSDYSSDYQSDYSSDYQNTHDNEVQNANDSGITPNIPNQNPLSASALLTDFVTYSGHASPKKIAQLTTDILALTTQLSDIGSVNLAATEALNAVNERLQPLVQQIDDIEASIQTLTDAINTIDNKTKTLFLSTLNAVNKDLSLLFAKVFGGGQAKLTLIEEDSFSKKDKWRSGLELMAQPKGKRNARLAVLSGGEKTLTALSLIFAIFKQHPAPFCVLDEVDAPLDDANVTRFTGLIQELANEVQFIFISHNKLSMQIADELKGVTMAQAGISSLVSVSLDEAEQYLMD